MILVPLPFAPKDAVLEEGRAEVAIDALRKRDIRFDPASTVWLGHDRITGKAAIASAVKEGGAPPVYNMHTPDASTGALHNGTPAAMASQATRPKPSCHDGMRATLAALNSL